MTRTYIHLGRNGDIINTLPLLQLAAAERGAPVDLVVASEYVGLLDGVSYANAIPFNDAFTKLPAAIAMAAALDPDAVNLQVYGHGYNQAKHTSSFVLEQWANAGMLQLWGAPLVFDRRDALREQMLAEQHIQGGKPVVLLALEGFSSPFAQGDLLKRLLRQQIGHHAELVDLAQVRAHRFYDLLGLFDRACCLVTIDTAHMHLAHGSSVPVVALSTDGPTTWHRSPRRAGHVWYGTYSAFAADPGPAIAAVVECVHRSQRPTLSAQPGTANRIVHVYSDYEMQGEALRRHATAKATWNRQQDKGWIDLPIRTSDLRRSAQDVGDHRDLPFVHDLIAAAIAHCDHPDDIVLLSNSDVGMSPYIASAVRMAVAEHGAAYTHRWDFERPIDQITAPMIPTGKWYPGSDLFAFSRGWWEQHGSEYPDLILGAEFVDAVMRQLIKLHAGANSEIHHAVFHEKHESYWWKNRHAPANTYNAKLAHEWFHAHNCDDLDPFTPNEAATIRSRRRPSPFPAP